MLRASTITAIGLATVAATASGQSIIDEKTDPAAILNVVRGWGSADMERDTKNRPKIRARSRGHAYLVFFRNCNDDGRNCKNLKLWNGYKKSGITLESMNKWNVTKRFGTAYLDSEGDPNISLFINLDKGVTHANLDDTFSMWVNAIIGGFKEHIGWQGG